MSVFNILTLLGGLAMFLYGMRLMSNELRESSSGTLKRIMESVTNNPFKAFLLGLLVTAVIQSSTATIVITSGLVAAGIISLHQSLGIVVGANVGTTVTGQIIRLLDLNTEGGTSWLQVFKPSTLAPVALIIGIILIMFLRSKKAANIGQIAIGFGILFTGLLTMTGAVESLSETGIFERIFSHLGESPLLGYVSGAGVAFALQSSSATIGILQTFSMSGVLTFRAIYAVIVGIYLGDCVTTAIVCSIGAKAEAKRVGIVNILFNLSETVLVLVVVTVLHKVGVLDSLWDKTVRAGEIANTNTIFNLGCSILLFPLLGVYEKLANKIIKNDKVAPNPYADKLDALSPAFFSTPALALRSCYDILMAMFTAASGSIDKAMKLNDKFDAKVFAEIEAEEDRIDNLADRVSIYMVDLSGHLTAPDHMAIMNQYYKLVNEFERLGDHALNIAQKAQEMNARGSRFTDTAVGELRVLHSLIDQILDLSRQAFERRDVDAAHRIEPLEEVTDDMIYALRENHVTRLREGNCNLENEPDFFDVLSDLERVSDICSNVGVATIVRVQPELANRTHDYISFLHSGRDDDFNNQYHQAHDRYFGLLNAVHGN